MKKLFKAVAKQFYFKEETAPVQEGNRTAVVKTNSFLRIFQCVSGKIEESKSTASGATFRTASHISIKVNIPPAKAADEAKKLFQTGKLS